MYPGPNTLRFKSSAVDIGLNNRGDVAYLSKGRYTVSVVKNDRTIATYRTIKPTCIDITSNGTVLTDLSGYKSTRGKYKYKTIDISEGGGNIYCLANNTKTTNLYKKNGSSWTRIASSIKGSRITVDLRGRPWVMYDQGIRLYRDNGSFTSIAMPIYRSSWDRLVDIGSAGNDIYVSMVNLRNRSNKQLLKYSTIADQLIRQPGSASNLDGEGSGIIYTN